MYRKKYGKWGRQLESNQEGNLYSPASKIEESDLESSNSFARRILVLLAHPSLDRSEVNRPLAVATAAIDGVTVADLYAEYPNFDIDVDREQTRLLNHDVIVFLHPLYWYSTPSILKEWQDIVLEYGFAYGSSGKALHGKIFFNAITAGGAEAAYRADGYNHFTIRELLHPLEQSAMLCGMTYLPPYALFSARTAVDEGRIEEHVENWIKLLQAIRDDRLDLFSAQSQANLNHHINELIREV